jgi:hypothetical protein
MDQARSLCKRDCGDLLYVFSLDRKKGEKVELEAASALSSNASTGSVDNMAAVFIFH